MRDILNANQTARVMRCAPQMVRERIKRNIWTFGRAVTPEESGRKLTGYEINKRELAEFLKIPVEEINRRLGDGANEADNPIP